MSTVTVAYLAQGVLAHETALIDITLDAVDAALARVLPHRDVTVVFQAGLALGVLGYHNLIVVNLAKQVFVVEVCAGVDERLLAIVAFDKFEKTEQRIAERTVWKAGGCLDIDHRHKVLLAAETLRGEVLQLFLLGRLGAIEMIRAHFQTVAVSDTKVVLITLVDTVAAFCGFDIYIRHARVLAYYLPKDIALIVADVYAMDVCTRVLTLNQGCLG